MAQQAPDAESADRGDGYAGTPRWVKLFGIIAVAVLLLSVSSSSAGWVVRTARSVTARPLSDSLVRPR